MLEAERGKQKLSRKQVAQELNLSESMISALENDQEFTDISPTYVRGYQRAYVRLLGINESEVLDDLSPAENIDKSQQDMHYFDKNLDLSSNKSSLGLFPKLATVIALAAIAIFSWPKLSTFFNLSGPEQSSQTVSQAGIQVLQGEAAGEQNSDNIDSDPVSPGNDDNLIAVEPVEEQVIEQPVEEVTENGIMTTQVISLANDLDQSTQLDQSIDDTEVSAAVENDQIESKITELLQPAELVESQSDITQDADAQTETASVNEQDSPATITFVSNGESWLSIADADDNKLYRNTLKLDRVSVTGSLPLYVSTGNVAVLRILAEQGEQQKVGIYDDSKTVAKFFVDLDAEGRLTFTPR